MIRMLLFSDTFVIDLYIIVEKEMAAHSSILAWRIPWTEEPDRLQSMGSQSVRHDLAINTLTFCFIYPQKTYQERKQVRFGYICH